MERYIVFDNGSGFFKAGFAGEESPSCIFPNIIGHTLGENSENHTVLYFGNKARERADSLHLNFPIRNGTILNWEDMECVWDHTFSSELRVDPKEHPVLMTEDPLNNSMNREKMTEIMFEKFGTPAMYTASQPVLSLYSTGEDTGLVLQSGFDITHIVPIYKGNTITHAMESLPFGGRHLTEFLWKMLEDIGYSFKGCLDLMSVSEIKQNLCFVSQNYEHDLRKDNFYSSFIVPDGRLVKISKENFICPETLFQPSLLGLKNTKGIHEALVNSISKCDRNVQKELYKNILLSGGNTMFSGFVDRLSKEISHLIYNEMKIKIKDLPNRYYSAWLGGSMLASREDFRNMWISISEYHESGPLIVHRKCLEQNIIW